MTSTPGDTCAFYIALGYTSLGIALGLASLILVLFYESLRLLPHIGAYVLAFAAISFINSTQTPWMQFANALTFIAVTLAAYAAWITDRGGST